MQKKIEEPMKSVKGHIDDLMKNYRHAFSHYASDVEQFTEYQCKQVGTSILYLQFLAMSI